MRLAEYYTGYCNPELQKMFEQQSMETDQEKRKRLVWEIDRRFAGGPGEAYRLSPAVRHLLATQGQGPEDDGQQRLQRLALGRRLARGVALNLH